MVDEQPKWRTGKLCYIESPAADVSRDSGEVFAWFSDPAGDTLGIYRQPGLAEMEAQHD